MRQDSASGKAILTHSRRGPAVFGRAALLAYLLFLLALIAGSDARRVGDGGEYLDLAQHLASLEAPPLTPHMWVYSALAAPALPLVQFVGLSPFVAFTVVNVVLLSLAFIAAADDLSWPMRLLLFASPILWWIDKAHTEVFTWSLLIIALVLMSRVAEGDGDRSDEASGPSAGVHPGWAVVCLGAAAAQNPPFAALALLAIIVLIWTRRASVREPRFLALCVAGLLLAGLHPVYYLARAGTWSLLSHSTTHAVPNIDELTAVLLDTNIGLVANAPALTLAIACSIVAVTRRSPRWLVDADVLFCGCAGLIFLASFAQTTNVNHGGTPGMSRYALWLIPLSIPALRRFDLVSSAREAGWMAALVAVSVVWSVFAFHPRRPEEYGRPSAFAQWVWTRHPSLTSPLPEIFIERLSGQGDAQWWLPVATPGCEKILLLGRGPESSIWPIPCPPVGVPPACARARALCYANRMGTGYKFSPVPTPSLWAYRFRRESVWSAAESRTVMSLLPDGGWRELHSIGRGSERRAVRSAAGVAAAYAYESADRVLVYLVQPGADACVTLSPMASAGAFLEGSTGVTLGSVTHDEPGDDPWTLAVPAGAPSVVLYLDRRR